MRHIVVIGATSAIASACIEIWANQMPTKFSLIARDSNKLQRMSKDFIIRFPLIEISQYTLDFLNVEEVSSLIHKISKVVPIEIALLAQGYLPEQVDCESDIELCKKTININAISPVLFLEALAQVMENQKFGTLAVIGSVAGDRGRKSNYVYGASKALIAAYMGGLSHRFSKSKINIILIKPGPVETPMTERYRRSGLAMASPKKVAKDITKGISIGNNIIYTPGKWRWVMLLIVHLPKFIFNRMRI